MENNITKIGEYFLFAIGQQVFFMHNNKVCSGPIERVKVDISDCGIDIKYMIKFDHFEGGQRYGQLILEKDLVFDSKQSLIKTL